MIFLYTVFSSGNKNQGNISVWGNKNEKEPQKGESLNLLRLQAFVAEEVGFEPTEPCGSPVFKTGAFDQLCYSSTYNYSLFMH